MDDDRRDNPRFAIISAIVLAILVAAALWYFFVFRQAPTTETPADITPEASPATEANLGFTPPPEQPNQPATTPAPVTQDTAKPQPASGQPVPTTSPTGPTEWVLASALAATVAGYIGLRRPR